MPEPLNDDRKSIVSGNSSDNRMHFNIVDEYESYLDMKGYKVRGIQESLRAVSYFLIYLSEQSYDVAAVRFKDAEDYREYLCCLTDSYGKTKYKPATINKTIAHLKSFYNYLVQRELVLVNPFNLVDRMKQGVKIPMNRLNKDQMKCLLTGLPLKTKADFKLKLLVELLYSTGARISEIEKLTLKDLDLKQGTILIRDDKDRQDRRLPLTTTALSLLHLFMDCLYQPLFDDVHVDCSVFAQGEPRSLNKWLNDRLKRVCKDLKLPKMTCHGIRHSIATHLLQAGANLRQIQQFLGHKRIKNTEIYASLMTEDLRKTIQKSHPRERR